MIILDENIDQVLIETLKSYHWEVFSIREHTPGLSEREVINKVREKQGILITEDKDFGELVFAHGFASGGISVIFLKSEGMHIAKAEEMLVKAIKQYRNTADNYFITIDKNKVRVTIL